MTEPKKKMFIFQQSNKKMSNLNVRGRLFNEKLEIERKTYGYIEFFSIYKKKSLTIIVKYLRAFLTKASI